VPPLPAKGMPPEEVLAGGPPRHWAHPDYRPPEPEISPEQRELNSRRLADLLTVVTRRAVR